jgi:mono/diheme cytochrome c family protein
MARSQGAGRSVTPRWHGAVAAVTAALVVAAGACSPTLAQQETASAPAEPIAAGVAVYRAQYCGACHSLAATGSRGTFGPSHDGMAATAAQRLADP